MADTRRLGSQRTRTMSRSAKGIVSLLLIIVGAGFGYGYFPNWPAPVGERGDRIDFSSLATVVTIDEYAASQVQGLSSRYKDDKLGLSGMSAPLAATSIVKDNFGAPKDAAAPDLSAVVAKYSTKLQHHLDSGWNASAARRADSQPVSSAGTALGGRVGGSLSGGAASLGGGSGISGLAP